MWAENPGKAFWGRELAQQEGVGLEEERREVEAVSGVAGLEWTMDSGFPCNGEKVQALRRGCYVEVG